MDRAKRERLERAGFKVGSAADFLGLSAEENELIELRLAASHNLKRRRKELGLMIAEEEKSGREEFKAAIVSPD